MSTRMQTLGSWTLLLPTLVLADWQESYRKGEGLLEQGRQAEAIKELSLALREAQSDQTGQSEVGVILDALGRAEFQMGQYRSAKIHMERSVAALEERAKDQAIARANLAQACQALGEFANAEQLLRRALEALPESAQLWQQLGQMLYLERRLDEAEAVQRRALAIAEKVEPSAAAVAWSDLAVLFEERKEYRKAIEMLDRGIAMLEPGQRRAMMLANLGGVHAKAGRKDEAVRRLADALAEMEPAVGRDHPDVGRILEQYAAALRESGRKPEAKAMLKRAESIRSAFSAQTNSGRATVDWRDLR